MIVQGEIYQIKWKQSVFQIANCLTKNEEWDLSKIDFSVVCIDLFCIMI